MLTFGSLFAGIGGLDLGLERAGMICRWQVEIDDYCTKVLEKHWPDVRRYGDVRKCGRHNLETVDLIAGGFPCQPHSVAGKQAGAEDDRNLWPEYSRIIAELRPRYVLAENVPGIKATYLDHVLSDLEGQAYTCATFNLPAVAFDAPHRRERIFIVAHTTSRGTRATEQSRRGDGIESGSKDVSDSAPLLGTSVKRDEQDRVLSEVLADASSKRPQGQGEHGGQFNTEKDKLGKADWIIDGCETTESHWHAEPDVGRVAHGIPSRVDRLRALGNAVVPQVAEWIGRRLMEFEDVIAG